MPEANDAYLDPSQPLSPPQAVRVVIDSYDRSRGLLVDPKRAQWQEWKKAYRGILALADNDNMISSLVINWAFINVEAILPRLAGATPRIEVWPRSKEDSRRASVHRYLLKYDWQILQLVYKSLLFAKSAEIYGTAWMKTSYRKQTAPIVGRQIAQQENVLFGTQRPTVEMGLRQGFKWDDCHIDYPCVDEVFPDPDGTDVDSCQWIIHRVRTNLSEIKSAQQGGGKSLYDEEAVAELEKILKEGSNSPLNSETGQSLRSTTLAEVDNTHIDNPDPYKREVHLLEYWSDDRVIVVAEEMRGQMQKPLRNEANITGMKPFVRFCPIPDPESIYGLSIVETVFHPMVEDSLLHNANLDSILQTVYPMFTALDTANINVSRLRFKAGGVIPLGDHGDLQQLQMNHNDFALHRHSQDLRGIIERLGTTDTFQGLGTPGATATEAQLLSEASGSKAALMFRLLSYQAFAPLGRQLMRWNELFLDRDKNLGPLLGETFTDTVFDEQTGQLAQVPVEFQTIKPEDMVNKTNLDMDLTIDVAIDEPGNAAIRFQRASQILPAVSNTFPPDHPVSEAVWIEFLRGSGINDRPEALFRSAEAQASIERQRAAEQGGGGPGDEAPESQTANAETEGDVLAATNPASQVGGLIS